QALKPTTNSFPYDFGGQNFSGLQYPDILFNAQSKAKSAGLSYSDFGEWSYKAGNYFYAGGMSLAPGALPPAGSNISATYDGSYIEAHSEGQIAGIPVTQGSDAGSIQIRANFGPRTVTADFTSGLLQGEVTAVSGTVASNGGYTVSASNYSVGGNVTANLTGGFFGPSGAGQTPPETAGTFTGNYGTASLNGAYGAKR
ncbi:MAG: transferrin-binding protein-like solute binding protein, partial [Stellaceae bacterium]